MKRRRPIKNVSARIEPGQDIRQCYISSPTEFALIAIQTKARRDKKRLTKDTQRPDFLVILVFPMGTDPR